MDENRTEPGSSIEELAETKERIEKEQDSGIERIMLNEQLPTVKPHKGVKAQKVFQKIGHILNKCKVLIILIIIAVIAFVVYRRYQQKQELAKAMAMGSQLETATIEKRDLTSSITTTGTVEAQEVRKLTSAIKDIKITSVNVEVGDIVTAGDILVTFSDEDINRTIADLQEDISVSEKKEAIESEAQNREYLYTYGTEATSMSTAAEKVEDALNDLHEACDAYSKAKSDRDTAKAKLEEARSSSVSGNSITSLESAYTTAESKVTTTYQAQVSAQKAYDSAVENQATSTRSAANSLSTADENYQKDSLTQGDSTKDLKRQLEDKQESLSDYVVTAPIDGIVTSLSVESGNGFIGGEIMTIQNIDSYTISTEVDEYDIPDIELGQKVVIKTDATRDDELEGVVSFVAPIATSAASNSSGVTYNVKIDILTKDDRLKIGMSAKLNIIVDEVSGVLTVPYDAVTENTDGESVIYVLDGINTAMSADGNLTVSGDVGAAAVTSDTAGTPMETDAVAKSQTANKSSDAKKEFGNKDGDISGASTPAQREIVVEVGMESDYYTQISSSEISEGMNVVIQSASTNGSGTGSDQAMTFNMGGGGPGGGGGAPGGGPSGF